MSKFKHLTETEIREHVSDLEGELLTCKPERLKEIQVELDEAAQALAAGEYRHDPGASPQPFERRSPGPVGQTQILASYQIGTGQVQSEQRTADRFASMEYRLAFMDYALRGIKSDTLEFRTAEITGTGDIGAVIPQPIIEKVYEKLSAYSMIWDRITKTSHKGGVKIPVSSLKPTASWVSEGEGSATQKKTISSSITFGYHKLQCRVAITLEAETVSLGIFENTIVQNITEAMLIAVEQAVISGSGDGQPLGITKDTSVTQEVTVSTDEIGTYEKWCAISAEIPLAYETKVVLCLTKKDFEKYCVGMVDSNGQPVARVTYGLAGRPERRLLGYEVVLVDDYLKSIDAAEVDDVFGFFADFKDYIFNSNLQMRYKKYIVEETDDLVHKSTLIADGKLAAPHSVVLLKKKAK